MFKDFGTDIFNKFNKLICQEIRERDKIVNLNNNYQLIYGMELRSYAEKINVEVKTFLKVISAHGIQPRIQFCLDVGKEENYYTNCIINRRMEKYPRVINVNFNIPDNMDYVKDLKLSAGSFDCDVQLTDIGMYVEYLPISHIRFTNDTYDHFYTGRHLTDGFINRNGDCFCGGGRGIQTYIPYEHKNKDVNFDFNLPSLPKEINGFYVEAENNNGNMNCFFCEGELIDFNGIKVCTECDKKGEKK